MPLVKAELEILPTPFPSLGDSETHVWFLDLIELQQQASELSALLSPDEQERAAQFKFDRDRLEYTITRGVLRLLLGAYLQSEPQAFQFTYNLWGKPSLSTTCLHFNVAHSHNFSMLAFNLTCSLGVDIEWIHPNFSIQNLTQLVLTDTEIQVMSGLPSSYQPLAFFQAWTRKEAYIKALGRGLSIQLNTLEVGFDLKAVTLVTGLVGERHLLSKRSSTQDDQTQTSLSLKDWQLMDFWQIEGYAACLCVGNSSNFERVLSTCRIRLIP
ncbi:MAG: 4'-phosphopantetheinyl transferase superfamily protein [Nodosilinea sp. WJT8-NPBG4]|nr:4'-phosphopantetheinyl transferase superfamily protein [Nodosilinea sp. WJT8-NPBG4]